MMGMMRREADSTTSGRSRACLSASPTLSLHGILPVRRRHTSYQEALTRAGPMVSCAECEEAFKSASEASPEKQLPDTLFQEDAP